MPRTEAEPAPQTPSLAELAATVSAVQVQLVGVQTQMRKREDQNESLRETIVNLTHENQLLKRRIYGNKTERSQTSELQLSLGSLLDAEKQLQKQLDQSVASAKADGSAASPRRRSPAGSEAICSPASPGGPTALPWASLLRQPPHIVLRDIGMPRSR